LPDSPAAAADLRRHDILLQYDDEKIRDGEHLARLIRADRPGRKVKLMLFRAGREINAEATLALGPVLQIAQATRPGLKEAADSPSTTAKANGPPVVSVAATPLGDGQVKLTIEYYQDTTGRLKTVNCAGTPDDIQRELIKLPTRVQDLTRVALDRLRALELQKGPQPASATRRQRP
jgi:hypothetical protein